MKTLIHYYSNIKNIYSLFMLVIHIKKLYLCKVSLFEFPLKLFWALSTTLNIIIYFPDFTHITAVRLFDSNQNCAEMH